MKNIIKLIVSVFYIGFTPYMPGTAASLAALLIFYSYQDHKIFLFSLMFISGILGFMLCGEAEKIFKEKDAKFIVIDEFFAMLLALMFTPMWGLIRPSLPLLILTFVIFRVMDLVKFWPIKRIEEMGGSVGVMLDDGVAAFYTIAIVRLITFFIDKIHRF